LCREKKTGFLGPAPAQGVIESSDLVIQVSVVPGKENRIFIGLAPAQGVIESSDLVIQVIVLRKENMIIWTGASPRRHREQRSRQPEKFSCYTGDFEKLTFLNASNLDSLRFHQHVIVSITLEFWEKKRPRQINRSVLVIW
jgi:hypothetical protein